MSGPHAARPEELLEHTDWLIRLARRLVRDSSTAEDLAQDTLVKALRNPPQSDRPLRPWLATLLRNLSLSKARNDARRETRESDVSRAGMNVQSAADVAETTETLSVLIAELHRLDEPLRTVVSMRYLRGWNSNQIANELGLPAGTVRWRLKNGLDTLRAELDIRFGGGKQSRLRLLALVGPELQSSVGVLGILFACTLAAFAIWWGTSLSQSGLVRGPVAEYVDKAAGKPGPRGQQVQSGPEATANERVSLGRQAFVPRRTGAPLELGPDQVAVSVQILSHLGSPMRGASFVWRDGRDAWTVSGDDGWAVLRFRPQGDRVRASFLIREHGYATRIVFADVQTGEWTPIGPIALIETQTIAGRVVDEAGNGLANVSVIVSPSLAGVDPAELLRSGPMPWNEYHIHSPVTGRDGRFRLADVPATQVRVWAAAPDTLFAFSEPLSNGAGEILLTLKPLPRSGAIEGVILGKDGKPVPYAFLHLLPRPTLGQHQALVASDLPKSQRWRTKPPRIETDAAGRFRFTPRELIPFDILVEDGEDRWQDIHLEAVPPGTGGLELQFIRDLE